MSLDFFSPGQRQSALVWDGSEAKARQVVDWSRNSAWQPRAQVNVVDGKNQLRVLIERVHDSNEWVVVPYGTVLHIDPKDPDKPITGVG